MAEEKTQVEEAPVEETPDRPRDFSGGADTTNFIGTDPIYQNYPDDRMKPFMAEGGEDAEIEAKFTDPKNFAWRKPPEHGDGKQIVGSGSSRPLVTSAISGSVVSSDEYDGDDDDDENESDENDETPKKVSGRKPAKAAGPKAPGVS